MADEKKQYIVTALDIHQTESLWQDLSETYATPETIPDRSVEVANPRPNNEKNTTYWLTETEAEALRQDSRVEAVTDLEHRAIRRLAFQEGTFDKGTANSGERQNWGLLRHISTTNNFGTSFSDPGGTYDYVLDGTGVDIVIIDSGIQADHPEFNDADGNSRVQQIDWYTEGGVTGTLPTGFYTDYDGHGTHVAGTIAGKTFGWAKNADIYSIKLSGLEGPTDPNGGISVDDAMDCLLGWHNAKTNGRPTVLNNSWGFVIYWNVDQDALTFNNVTYYPITGGNYRGQPWTGSTQDGGKGHTGQQVSAVLFAMNQRDAATDADITQLVNAGVIVCNAAGNGSMKHDVDGGDDYNNYISATNLGNYFYHRGSSPHIGANDGFQVGAFGLFFAGGKEAKSFYSDAGPGVNIFAAGDRIISALSNVDIDGTSFAYYLDESFKQRSLSGTSMACPQVAGMASLLLQVHPDWSPSQVYRWITQNTQTNILYTTGLDSDYSSTVSLYGSSGQVAYFPLSARNTFGLEITG